MAITFLQSVGAYLAGALGLLPPRRAIAFGSAFTVTDVPDASLTGNGGAVTGYTRIDLASGGQVLSYVAATQRGAGASAVWLNDTTASRTVSFLMLVPLDSLARDASNYWTITVALASAIGSPLITVTTNTSGGVDLQAGVAMSLPDAAVPAGDALVVKLAAAGTPATVGVYLQGR